jgi:hypothetical protein
VKFDRGSLDRRHTERTRADRPQEGPLGDALRKTWPYPSEIDHNAVKASDCPIYEGVHKVVGNGAALIGSLDAPDYSHPLMPGQVVLKVGGGDRGKLSVERQVVDGLTLPDVEERRDLRVIEIQIDQQRSIARRPNGSQCSCQRRRAVRAG